MVLSDQIGKVKMDYSHYPGEDFYCDGAIEDEMLDIAMNYSPVEYGRIIEERANWPIMYHFSQQRENIVDWLDIDKSSKVLEIGSGCGAITGALARKAGSVTCVDLSKKRSLINAYRHQNCDNITISVGNFKDIEPDLDTDYDYCLLIGVFEYGQSYIGGDTPYEDFLKIIRKHTKGKIAIAIENRYGMKYWAGCQEDHLGRYFKGLEGYEPKDGVKTFSKTALRAIFESCNEHNYSFYYPYPDYKFMHTLFSDRRLPEKGELCTNDRNFDRDRIRLFNEREVFDGILEDGRFDEFSNSYMIILGGEPELIYTRYSNDRAPKYQIATDILAIDGQKIIKKRALSKEAMGHIKSMRDHYDALHKRYENSSLSICPAKIVDEGSSIIFPEVKGVQLASLLDDRLIRGDEEGFLALLEEYVNRIDAGSDIAVADMDLVFSNILIDGDTWTVIDYEWVEDKVVPTKEIAFRAIYCYILEDEKRDSFNYDLIIKKLDITANEEQGYRDKEAQFQKEVTGKRRSMPELRNIVGGRILSLEKNIGDALSQANKNRIKVYYDLGAGFSEENAYYLGDEYDSEGRVELSIEVPSEVVKLRIDPLEDYCISYIDEMIFNGEPLDIRDNKRVYLNGRKLKKNAGNGITAVFYNDDPNLVIELKDKVRSTGNRLDIVMQSCPMKKSIIEDMENNMKRMIML